MAVGVLCPVPILQFFGNDGGFLSGGSILTTVGGLNTTTYQDVGLTIPLPNPIPLNSRGEVSASAGASQQLFLTPNIVYTFTFFDASGNQQWVANYLDGVQINQTVIGQALWPQTSAELAGGITPTFYYYEPGNVLRYGIVPNIQASAAANTAIAQLLWNYNTVGPTGDFWFPNTTGSDIYYFNNVITVRGFCYFDLMGCTLNYSGTLTAGSANTNSGLFNFYNDFGIQNGSFVTAVDCTATTNGGNAIFVGGRGTDGPVTIWDSLLPSGHSLGRGYIRNITVNTTNTSTNASSCIGMLGGISDLIIENITLSCGNAVNYGIIYEFGWATNDVAEASRQTSHAKTMAFRNLRISNVDPAGGGAAIALGAAYNSTVDNLYVNQAPCAFQFYCSESLFYNPWAGVDDQGAKRDITLKNIVGEAITGTGISLLGAQSASGSYLAATIAALGHPFDYAAETDLMHFSLDGFSIGGTCVGINVSGPCDIRNGYLDTQNSSGSLIISDECVRFTIDNVEIRDNANGPGVRGGLGDAIWSPARLKLGTISNSFIAGNKIIGMQWINTEAVRISNCRIGYNTGWDVSNETSQTTGVIVYVGVNSSVAGSGGVEVDSCYVTVPGGGASYTITGTPALTNWLTNPKGTIVGSIGNWAINGEISCTSTQLGTATAAVNVYDKLAGSRAYSTSTNKLFVAQGATPTSTWISVDGATTISPS